jgi:hypothetical protein
VHSHGVYGAREHGSDPALVALNARHAGWDLLAGRRFSMTFSPAAEVSGA